VASQKDSAELSFVAGATGILLLVGWLFLYFWNSPSWAWVYLLIVDLLIFLACFVGFCVATLMYVLFKKLFSKNNPPQV
jgi:membrane protease YdiL (CAAX protease family)